LSLKLDASKEKILAKNLHATPDAIDKFYGDVGRYPDSLDELLLDPRYPNPVRYPRKL
jgi:hypothetical protein